MADAKKCDICGSFYDFPKCIDQVRIHIDLQRYVGDHYVDLCDTCYDKLCLFVAPTLPKDVSVERERYGGDKDEKNT